MTTSQRPIRALPMPNLSPAKVSASRPKFGVAFPTELLVDEHYQRDLSEKSISLIRRIVAGWDWTKFKPPLCADTPAGLEIIDGQHTAIAAASHPDVGKIPILIVEAPRMADRAMAFVSHNRDRLMVTQMQLYAAAVAAGDEDALTVAQVCQRAGLTILRIPPANGRYQPRTTVAIAAIRSLIAKHGPIQARQLLQALADANLAPVGVAHIRAVEHLIYKPEYQDETTLELITNAFLRVGDKFDQEARIFASAHDVPFYHALAVVIFRNAKRGRRRAS